MEDKQKTTSGKINPADERGDLGNEILNLLGERTKNPGEAFVLLQQLSIFIWAQYKIDWKNHPGHKVADSRKQRFLDFVSDMVDSIKFDETSTDEPNDIQSQ